MFYGLLAELIGAALITGPGTPATAVPAKSAVPGPVVDATATPSKSAAHEGYPCQSRKTGTDQRDAGQVAAMRPVRQIANSALSHASNDRVMRNEGDTQ